MFQRPGFICRDIDNRTCRTYSGCLTSILNLHFAVSRGVSPIMVCVCVCVRANIAYRAEQRASGPARFGRLVFWVELWSLAESKTKFALGFQSMAIQCCRSCDTSMVPKRFGINLRTWVTQQKLVLHSLFRVRQRLLPAGVHAAGLLARMVKMHAELSICCGIAQRS